MSEELKPCPFCGKVPEIQEEDVMDEYMSNKVSYRAYAIDCCNNICIAEESKEELLKLWNTRPEPEVKEVSVKEISGLIMNVPNNIQISVEDIDKLAKAIVNHLKVRG